MLLFVDDPVVIAGHKYDVSVIMKKLMDVYTKWGLKIILQKTEYLMTSY